MSRREPAESFTETLTPRGSLVLSEELPHVASVSLGVWLRAGSRHERPAEGGLTHFLEHMNFKGTPRRTARRIAEELDAVGGHLDASTGKETTSFYARVTSAHLPLACDVLADMLVHSMFQEEDVVRERDVVLDEIRMYQDDPSELVMDQMLEAFLGDHPLARPILGRPEVIAKVSREDLLRFRARSYGADRLVIAAAGQIKHAELLVLLAPLLEGLPEVTSPREEVPPVPRVVTRITSRVQEQVHLALAAPALPYAHPDRFVLGVLNNILGGSASSRLFQQVREQRGLTYAISSGVESFADGGALLVHTAGDPEKFGELAEVIGGILADMAGGRITEEEVARSREQLKGNIVLSLEGTSSRMTRLALSRMYLGRVTPVAEVMHLVDAVTTEGVRNLARRLLDPGRFTVTVLGPGSPDAYRVPWATGRAEVSA